MNYKQTKFSNGCVIIDPPVFGDDRGYFMQTFNQRRFLDGDKVFVQDNESMSSKGVIRGLHFQTGQSSQSKLVRVVKGAVIDFVLDLNVSHTQFGRVTYVYLSDKNKRQFYIPRGFAHGFIALEDNTIFNYKCDNFYNNNSQGGYNILSEQLNIIEHLKSMKECADIDFQNLIMSDKDKNWPTWSIKSF